MAIDPDKTIPEDTASVSSLQSMTEESAKAAMRAPIDGAFGLARNSLFGAFVSWVTSGIAQSIQSLISGVVGPPQFVNIQEAIWGIFDPTQEEGKGLGLLGEAWTKADEAQNQYLNLLGQEATRMLFADREQAVGNRDLELMNPKLSTSSKVTAKGDWLGLVVLVSITRRSLLNDVNEAWISCWQVTADNREFYRDHGVGPSLIHSVALYQKWSPESIFEPVENTQ